MIRILPRNFLIKVDRLIIINLVTNETLITDVTETVDSVVSMVIETSLCIVFCFLDLSLKSLEIIACRLLLLLSILLSLQ